MHTEHLLPPSFSGPGTDDDVCVSLDVRDLSISIILSMPACYGLDKLVWTVILNNVHPARTAYIKVNTQ